MLVNFNQLRSFYYAAKMNSISQAAKSLMVTPAAVTMQIKLFESEWGFNLLYREGRNIRLTEQGQSVYEKAESIFSDLRKLEDYLEEISVGDITELRIGCHEVPAKYIMPTLIEMFNRTYPTIKVILELGKTPVMLSKLESHEIPLALVVKKQSDAKFIVNPIIKDEIALVGAFNSNLVTENEISITDLQSLPLIVQEKNSGILKLINNHLEKYEIAPNIVMETGSLDMLKNFVLKDKGLAFVEGFAVLDQIKDKKLKKIKIKEGSPLIELGICHLKGKKLSPIIDAFLKMLEEKDLIKR